MQRIEVKDLVKLTERKTEIQKCSARWFVTTTWVSILFMAKGHDRYYGLVCGPHVKKYK